jgi:16S rRNA (guanine527-N7)-methyltransferase
LDQLGTYVQLLIKWNKAYNLVGKSTESEIHFRHVLDSAQLVPFVSCETKVLDIGSGAGLPAIVMAILSGAHVYACEPLGKRCTFMNEVRRQLKLHDNFTVLNMKAENVVRGDNSFNVISSRAVADASVLISISAGLLAENGFYLFLKGPSYEKEIASDAFSKMTISVKSSITSSGGKILKIKP